MAKTSETRSEGAHSRPVSVDICAPELKAWFLQEVLPQEAMLMQYLRHNWRDQSGIEDLLHDVYVRVYEAARTQIPDQAKAFVFTTARNLLRDRIRQKNIVPIEAVTDLDALGIAIDAPGPDRTTIARDELRHLQAAIDRLSPRIRQVVIMRRVDGLSRGEIAVRMNISEEAVSVALNRGMHALADILHRDALESGERL